MTEHTPIAPAIPGFVGMVSDLRSRAEAVGEGTVPTAWTPEHVGARLIEAFDILRRSGARVGPRQHANGWPAMVHEFADMIDPQARAQAERERIESKAAVPTADELSRMNEALAWPMAYLDGRPLAADALMLWAYATAAGRDMAGMLHQRKKRAIAMAEEMMRRRNALPHAGDCRSIADQWRAALRRHILREVAQTIPAAMAQTVLRQRVEQSGCAPYRFKPHDAMPGRALSRTNLDRQRKIAAAAVADGIRRAGVPVR